MYAVTKLSPSTQSFVSSMMQLNKSRSIQASMAIAKVISNKMNLPSAPVENVTEYYRGQCQIDADNLINDLNEIVMVDVKSVRDICSKMFEQRYRAAHPSDVVFTFNKESAIEDFFGITRTFDKSSLDAIKEDPIKLASYVNGFSTMVAELKV